MPVRVRDDTSTLRDSWPSSHKASRNLGDCLRRKAKGVMSGINRDHVGQRKKLKVGEKYGNEIMENICIAEGSPFAITKERNKLKIGENHGKDVMENICTAEGSPFVINGENGSNKARNIYVGQWDSIKERMVWESMDRDGGLHGLDGLATWSLHVEKLKRTPADIVQEKGVNVDATCAMHEQLHDKQPPDFLT